MVTGTAGFIGYHVTRRLLQEGLQVIGYDSVNDYYDPVLKKNRLAQLGVALDLEKPRQEIASSSYPGFVFYRSALSDKDRLDEIFVQHKITRVIHLAAQAGVRYSLENPGYYIESNISGFLNILECCRHHKINHLVYASSSSVYGLNKKMPFSVHNNVDHPVSLYAASKKSNELMAHSYSYLFGLPTTGLRFFTVYGPWGRPDMALFLFTKNILEDKAIDVYNYGKMERDFTYIDDIVEGITKIVHKPPVGNASWSGLEPDPATSPAPYRVYNIGNHQPVELMDFIRAIEAQTGKKAKLNMMPMQPGDVEKTWADVDDLRTDFNYQPDTTIQTGIREFITWYRSYYSK